MQTSAVRDDAVAETRSPSASTSVFRADIQGLRALAVGVVLLYHLWPNRFPGGFIGVDVFLVISGYLITSHLIAKPPRSWRSVIDFWARRIRRLLPASLLVLFVVGIAAYLVAPESTWADTGRQILTASFYVVNWDFAISSVDYLAADNAPSPVQHFWSLSVEEQFYFIWPMILGLAVLAGRSARGSRAMVASTVLAVFGISLGFSVWFTSVNPAGAYFVTPTRMWELAAGGLAAVFVAYFQRSRIPASSLIGWIGLAGIVAGVFLIRPEMPFPGTIALVPVVSTIFVIVADSRGSTSALPLLSLRPVQFLGNISYSVYLWHWPMIVLVPYLSEHLGLSENLGRLDKAVIVTCTIAIAWASTELVENRFRRASLLSSSRATFFSGAVAMILVGCLGLSLTITANRIVENSEDQISAALNDPDSCLGGRVLTVDADNKSNCADSNQLLTEPAAAKLDKSRAYADGCWSSSPYGDRPKCTYGDGEKQVALVGNSHAGQWLPALEILAKENNWTITTFLASNCSISELPQELSTSESVEGCLDYAEWVRDQTASGDFDAVITSERQSTPLQNMTWDETASKAPAGHRSILSDWVDAGLDVVVIRDTPYPGAEDITVPDCVAKNEDNIQKCSGSPDDWYWMDPLAESAEQLKSEKISIVYPEKWFCPAGRCEPVIGGVITYFDTAHITATYAKTLAPQLGDEINRSKLATFK